MSLDVRIDGQVCGAMSAGDAGPTIEVSYDADSMHLVVRQCGNWIAFPIGSVTLFTETVSRAAIKAAASQPVRPHEGGLY